MTFSDHLPVRNSISRHREQKPVRQYYGSSPYIWNSCSITGDKQVTTNTNNSDHWSLATSPVKVVNNTLSLSPLFIPCPLVLLKTLRSCIICIILMVWNSGYDRVYLFWICSFEKISIRRFRRRFWSSILSLEIFFEPTKVLFWHSQSQFEIYIETNLTS